MACIAKKLAGAALGAVVGDALGAAVEGHGPADVAKTFGPLGCRAHRAAAHMGVYHLGERRGCYTDDTNSAVAMLRSLVALRRVDGGDIAYRHARQWLDGYALGFVRGYPDSAQKMMLATLDGKTAHQCATIAFPTGSYANGAAMKVWPLALAMHDTTAVGPDAFYGAVAASCCFSHCHPQAIDAAASLGEAIRWALRWTPPVEAGAPAP